MNDTAIPLIDRTRAALLVVDHAQRIGLPLPFNVEATDYRDEVHMIFRTLAELTDWALWLESPITEKTVGDRVHHTVDGTALDQPVHLAVVVPAAATVGAGK